jgi:hypothetical protein
MDDLRNRGYTNVFIMEGVEDVEDEKTLDEKFARIIDQRRPELIFAFFHPDVRMDAVIFEIGWLCGRYTSAAISKKLRVIYEKEYDFYTTTAYIRSLLPMAASSPFNPSDPVETAAFVIHKLVIAGQQL